MVSIATGFGKSGFQEWLLQRVTAVFMLVYIGGLVWLCLCTKPLDFTAWQAIFAPLWMKIATVLMVASICIHAWIGIWTVTTDYIKPLWLRIPCQCIFNLGLIAYVIWAIDILWGL